MYFPELAQNFLEVYASLAREAMEMQSIPPGIITLKFSIGTLHPGFFLRHKVVVTNGVSSFALFSTGRT